MDEKTLEALKASIRHWEENVAAETVDKASTFAEDCELCEEFQLTAMGGCPDCPVMIATGFPFCRQTPYWKAVASYDFWGCDPHNAESRDAFRKAAQAELDFLRSLLPPGEE